MKHNLTPEQVTFIKEWIVALRSGNYKQTMGTLRDDVGYCCLGVLCDINKDMLKGEFVKASENHDYQFIREEVVGVDWDFPSADILTKIGIDDQLARDLAIANDVEMSFNEIADKLEAYYITNTSDTLIEA